jgi:polyisoprenoid-binding protein YceI
VKYVIDPERSTVGIAARSSLHPIHSSTSGLTGWVDYDGTLTAGRLELPVAKLRSGNPLLDREMQRRIGARSHPTISGVLTAATAAGRVTGDVTFRGVTKPYEDNMTITADDAALTLALEGSHVFDVRDFDFQPPRVLGLRVYPEVTVTVRIVAAGESV